MLITLLDMIDRSNMVQEAEKAAEEQEQREFDIARGNPLLNPKDFNMKRRHVDSVQRKACSSLMFFRWDDDVVFKNQARGTEDKKPKEFVNDLLRSDFHKRFMVSVNPTSHTKTTSLTR